MNLTISPILALLIFPGGLFLLLSGLVFEFADRKLVARFQNRVGPRWFQPLADLVKLLAKEEIIPAGTIRTTLSVVGMVTASTLSGLR